MAAGFFDGLKAGNDCDQIASLPSLSSIASVRYAADDGDRTHETEHTKPRTVMPAGFFIARRFSGASVPDTAGKNSPPRAGFFYQETVAGKTVAGRKESV